jgi:hypothetical protein
MISKAELAREKTAALGLIGRVPDIAAASVAMFSRVKYFSLCMIDGIIFHYNIWEAWKPREVQMYKCMTRLGKINKIE